MDAARNPFHPGLAAAPPLLAGRGGELAQAALFAQRLKLGRAEKGLLWTGLRGSGKTSLLLGLESSARNAGCATGRLDGLGMRPLAVCLVAALRRALEALQGPLEGLWEPLEAFAARHGTVAAGVQAPGVPGTSPAGGPLADDLAAVLLSAGNSARRAASALILCVDDVHLLEAPELEALVLAQEALLRERSSLGMVLAGLPLSWGPEDGLRARAARVFSVGSLPPLDEAAVTQALQVPAGQEGASFSAEALREILRLSRGLPAFVQTWAYEAWNQSQGPDIGLADLRRCAPMVTRRLDSDFYGPGFERLSPRERDYLRSMAHLGPGPHLSGDIADSMDAKIQSLGPLRAKLMRQGLIYSPRHGSLGFTAAGYDEFMRRVMPHFR